MKLLPAPIGTSVSTFKNIKLSTRQPIVALWIVARHLNFSKNFKAYGVFFVLRKINRNTLNKPVYLNL